MFDYMSMAKETIELLKNYEYRKIKGNEAKLSLDKYEKKYYNEKLAKEHLEKHYGFAKRINKHFKCHTFENITNLKYINNIKACNT